LRSGRGPAATGLLEVVQELPELREQLLGHDVAVAEEPLDVDLSVQQEVDLSQSCPGKGMTVTLRPSLRPSVRS
jgi:hypothetical protein